MQLRYALVLAGAAIFSACAGSPKPTNELVQAQSALRAAREVGAAEVPEAQLHVQLADEQLRRADKLMNDGDNAEAQRVLERAKADAELAVALAREADAQKSLEQSRSNAPEHGSQSLSMTASQ
jgi:hypothetical protein